MNIVVIIPYVQYAKQLPISVAYKMEMWGKPQFYWSLLSLSDITADRYIFVVPRFDDASQFIAEQCWGLRITEYKIVEYDFHISGQAECVMVANPYIRADQSLLVWNIGMVVEPGEITSGQFCGDGYILSLAPAGRRWPHEAAPETLLLQNYPIHSHSVVGGFYFSSAALFEQLYHDCYIQANKDEDKNIGSLYDRLIRHGGTVYSTNVSAKTAKSRNRRIFQNKGKAMRMLHLLLNEE